MVWGLSTDSQHFQSSGPQRIETIQKHRRLIKRSPGSPGSRNSFKRIRTFLRSKSTSCFEGGSKRDRFVSDTPRPKKDLKVSFTTETSPQVPSREKASPFPASPAPQRKFNRSSSIGCFIRHTKPDKIVNDALKSKKQEAIEEAEPGKDDFLVIEEPRPKSQQQTPMSNSEYEPLLRPFKTVQPASAPKPKPKVGILNALKGGLEKFLMKLAEITISLCQGVFKMMKRKKPAMTPSGSDKGSAAESAPKFDVMNDMKLLGWELILDPSRRDTVICDIARAGGTSGWLVTAGTTHFTKILKSKLEDNIPSWVSEDLVRLSENLPGGWDEYVESLPPLKKKEVTDVSGPLFEGIANKLPASYAPYIGEVATRYKNERLGIPVEVVQVEERGNKKPSKKEALLAKS